MDKELKYLAAYTTRAEAEAIKGLLETNGIKCFLQLSSFGDAMMGGLGTASGPSELWVLEKDLEKARGIVNADRA